MLPRSMAAAPEFNKSAFIRDFTAKGATDAEETKRTIISSIFHFRKELCHESEQAEVKPGDLEEPDRRIETRVRDHHQPQLQFRVRPALNSSKRDQLTSESYLVLL